MGTIASQITGLTIVYSTVYSDADQRTHQSSASLAFVRGIHWWPVNFPHKWLVTRKMLPFDDVLIQALDTFMASSEGWTTCHIPNSTTVSVLMPWILSSTYFNTMRPGQNTHHFADDLFKCISWMKTYRFRIRFHWNLFWRFQLTAPQHWFR